MSMLTVFSVKGGCGASIIATNLALALARAAPTVLLDLHAHTGTNDLLLDMRCPRAWPELLPVALELTDRSLELVACRHAEGLHLLAAPATSVDDPTRDPRVRPLLEALGPHYAWIVVDAPSGAWSAVAAEPSDLVLLVATADPPTLRCAARLLQSRPLPGRDRLGLVLNQFSRGQPASASEVAASLDIPLLAVVPVDPRGAGYQVNFGYPCALDGQSAMGRATAALARRVLVGAKRGTAASSIAAAGTPAGRAL